MTLSELRYLVTLAQQKHFGKAAKLCSVSQPTLSVAIKNLENKLGVNIFERYSNEVRITEVGEKIIIQAQRALEEITAIKHVAESHKSQLNSPLKIGAIYTVAPYLFPKLIPTLKNIAPQMPLIIQEDFTANLRIKLRRGELDAIFIALPFVESDVVTKPLFDEPFVVLMRKDHALTDKKAIDNKDLAQENILLLGQGHCMRDQVLTACVDCKIGEQQTFDGASLETLRHMVASGVGMTILPNTATQVDYYNSILCVKPFAGKTPHRTVALAWRVSFPRTKAIDALIKALSECKLNGICLLPEPPSF